MILGCQENRPLDTKQSIGGDKSTGGGIVVAALQVVHAPFMVIHIPAIAERLPPAQRFRHGAGCRYLLSPCIIGIFYYRCAVSVNQLDNVTLCVPEVIVVVSAVFDRNHVARRVAGIAFSVSLSMRSRVAAGFMRVYRFKNTLTESRRR